MKRQIENLIPAAIQAIKNNLCPEKRENGVIIRDETKVNEAYDGYIASFSTAINQSGLLSATAMYTDRTKTDKTKADKTFLMNAVLELLKAMDDSITEPTLFEYVLHHQPRNYQIKTRIGHASVALKLALRTFEQIKKSK